MFRWRSEAIRIQWRNDESIEVTCGRYVYESCKVKWYVHEILALTRDVDESLAITRYAHESFESLSGRNAYASTQVNINDKQLG